MTRGFSGIRQAVQEIEARKQGSGDTGGRIQWFKLKESNENARVRFLEQGDDVNWAWMHQLAAKDGQKFGDWEVCLNTNSDGTACPGCERKLPRKVKGFINLIWRDGPLFEKEEFTRDDGTKGTRFKRDTDGNAISAGKGPVLAVWNAGVTVFEELDGLDAAYHGLMTRDFMVTRKGKDLNTRYQILPLDPEPLSDADKELLASKHDLSTYVTPKSYEDWGKSDAGGEAETEKPEPGAVNPFLKTRQ